MTKTIRLYSTRDDKMAQFCPPFSMLNDGVAIRGFGDAIAHSKEGDILHEHPEDISLWFVGDFDIDTGFVKPVEPVKLAQGSDFVQK